MNVAAFRQAYGEANRLIKAHHLPNPYADEAHARLRELRRVMREAPKPEHDIVENVASWSLGDQVLCACAWTSRSYWDGWEYAVEGWYRHVAEEMGILAKKCPCGKEYVPADGGKPCHELVEKT